jgi:hypothetical protein
LRPDRSWKWVVGIIVSRDVEVGWGKLTSLVRKDIGA